MSSRNNPQNFRLKPVIPKEDYEHFRAKNWLEASNLLFYHVPNGGRRSALEGLKLKRMGVKPGVPDFVIAEPRGKYHGAYGEIKRIKGGKVSPQQAWWLAELEKRGYYVFVANGAEEFINHVKIYLGATP